MTESVLEPILAAIAPASDEHGRAARKALQGAGRDGLGQVERLAERLAAARGTGKPDIRLKHAVICAADHGVALPSARPGALPLAPPASQAPGATVAAMEQIAAGKAAVNAAARTASASVAIVDCGTRAGSASPGGIMDLRIGAGTADIRHGPAMTEAHALTCVQTGIALMLSLADAGARCIALGQVAAGSLPVSAAVTAALTDMSPEQLGDREREVVEAALQANQGVAREPLDVLAALGGFDLGIMAGIVLAAASLRVPVVLDDHGTSAAAVIAARMAPAVTGYLFASHAGSTPCHGHALDALGLQALFDLGIAHGEGTGAVLALPMLDSAARMVSECTHD